MGQSDLVHIFDQGLGHLVHDILRQVLVGVENCIDGGRPALLGLPSIGIGGHRHHGVGRVELVVLGTGLIADGQEPHALGGGHGVQGAVIGIRGENDHVGVAVAQRLSGLRVGHNTVVHFLRIKGAGGRDQLLDGGEVGGSGGDHRLLGDILDRVVGRGVQRQNAVDVVVHTQHLHNIALGIARILGSTGPGPLKHAGHANAHGGLAALQHGGKLLKLCRGDGDHFHIGEVLVENIHHAGAQNLIDAAWGTGAKQDLLTLSVVRRRGGSRRSVIRVGRS